MKHKTSTRCRASRSVKQFPCICIRIRLLTLTIWGHRVTHICISKLCHRFRYWLNGLLPARRQAIIWTNVRILSNIRNKHQWNSNRSIWFHKMRLEMSSATWRPFRLSLNVHSWHVGYSSQASCFQWTKVNQIYHNNMELIDIQNILTPQNVPSYIENFDFVATFDLCVRVQLAIVKTMPTSESFPSFGAGAFLPRLRPPAIALDDRYFDKQMPTFEGNHKRIHCVRVCA